MALIASQPSATASTTSAVSTWWLSDPTDPTARMSLKVMPDLKSAYTERETEHDALGRPDPVTVSDVMGYRDGELTCLCKDAATYTSLYGLVTRQRTLLLQSPYGDQWYIRIVGTRDIRRPWTGAADAAQTLTFRYRQAVKP